MHRVRLLGIFSSLLLSIILLLTMFGSGCAPAVTEKPTIRLIEGNWTSMMIATEIVDQIITKQLGYPTEKK